MGANSKLNFDIYARDQASPVFDKFGRQVKRTGDDVDKTGKKMGGAGGGVKKLMGAFVGAAVISKAVGFLKDANDEARESQKVNALTANALKTTGASAWQSAPKIAALSTAISNKTGVDDEAIQSAANLLLTFKDVRNEAGKGSDIFDRATRATQDMAASFGGDAAGQAIKLGKALNDPVKGVSALNKIGVTFTAGQKKQIAAMVAAGDTLGAQKIILKEVESQVKGSAAAQATAADKLKVSWGNFQEDVGTKLIPIFDKMAIGGTKAIAWMSKNPGAMKGLAAGLLVLAAAFVVATVAAFWLPIAIAALVGGLVVAYNKVGWFKKGVNMYFKAMGAIARWLWNNALGPMLKNIVGGVGKVMIAFGKMLVGISKIKGFGWAKKAGEAMQNAGNKALGLADKINKIPSKKEIRIQAETAAAWAKLDSIVRKIRDIHGKTVGIHVSKGGQGGTSTAYAKGTNWHPGGMAWVGEQGPELVDLPRGSKVYTADKSKQMAQGMASTASGGGSMTEVVAELRALRAEMRDLEVRATLAVDGRTAAKIVTKGARAGARLS